MRTTCPLCEPGDHDAQAGVPHDTACAARAVPVDPPAVVRLRARLTPYEIAERALGSPAPHHPTANGDRT